MATLVIAQADFLPLRRVSLEGRDVLTLGRSTLRDVIVSDAAVSRLHCVLFREFDVWTIADTGSSGGTSVDRQRIIWKRLRPGRVAEVGTLRLWIEPDRSRNPRSGESVTDTELGQTVREDDGLEGCPGPLSDDTAGDPSDRTSVFLGTEGDFLPLTDD